MINAVDGTIIDSYYLDGIEPKAGVIKLMTRDKKSEAENVISNR